MITHGRGLLQDTIASAVPWRRRRDTIAGVSPFWYVFWLCLAGNVARLFGKEAVMMWNATGRTQNRYRGEAILPVDPEDSRFPFERIGAFIRAVLIRWTGADGSVDPWSAGRILAAVAIIWGVCCFYPQNPPFFSTSPAFLQFRYFASERVWGTVVILAGVGKLLAIRSGSATAIFWASFALLLFYVFAALCYMPSGYARFATLLFLLLAAWQIRIVIAATIASPPFREQVKQSAISNDWKRLQEWNKKRRHDFLKDTRTHDDFPASTAESTNEPTDEPTTSAGGAAPSETSDRGDR